MSHWASVRSLGCFVYFERPLAEQPDVVRSMVDDVVALDHTLKVSTATNVLRWRKLTRSTLVDALADGGTRGITWMFGTPQDVRLAGGVELRQNPAYERDAQSPPLAWLAAETERWPDATLLDAARRWLRVAAERGSPLSGGALVAATLKNAKIELTQVFETDPGEDPERNPTPFRTRMHQERSEGHNWSKIRRVYPITLLGPKFAAAVDAEQLRAAGAIDIEHVNGSLLFRTNTPMLEAWDPEFLEATRSLRRLLWPLMAQNPADDPEPPRARGNSDRRR